MLREAGSSYLAPFEKLAASIQRGSDEAADNLRFLTPVYPGDHLTVRLTCKEINPRAAAEHGEVRWDCQVTNQSGATVAQYDVLTMVAKTWP